MATLFFCVLWYSPVALLSQMNPIYILSTYFLMVSSHLSLGLPSAFVLHCFPTKIMYLSYLSHASYISCLYHTFWFDHPSYIPSFKLWSAPLCTRSFWAPNILPNTSDPKHLKSAIVPYETTGPLSVSKKSGCPYFLNFLWYFETGNSFHGAGIARCSGLAIGYTTEESRLNYLKYQAVCLPQKCSYRPWGPLSLLSSGYWGCSFLT